MPIPSLRPNFVPQIQAELERLYADALQTDPDVRRAAQEFGLINESDPGFYEAMSQAYLPVTPDFGSLLYMIVRMTRARSVVEFGMSFGISTIHLAAALRDLGSGKVIADAQRAQALLENVGQQTVTPQMLHRFAGTARQLMRTNDGGYRRDHLRLLAQRVEVADKEVRIIGSRNNLLKTLVAISNSGVKSDVPSFVPKWRRGCPPNPHP